jgi:hypothetical protein
MEIRRERISMEKIGILKSAKVESYLANDEMNYLGGSISISYFYEDKEVKIGHSSVYIFQLDYWIEVLDRADSITGDVLYVVESLYNTIEAENMFGRLLIIDEMSMVKNFDSLESRVRFLEKIMDYFELLGIENISFINEAICKDSVHNGKYINKYVSLGFRPILKKGFHHFTMVKNNDYF